MWAEVATNHEKMVTSADGTQYTQEQMDSLRQTEGFVRASLLISEPSEGMFSQTGHTALRLRCEKFDLDYVYHYSMFYATDSISELMAFLTGNFYVGMIEVFFGDYIIENDSIHRGITEYDLNLPAKSEQKLWELCENEVLKGGYLKYDFFKEGCAIMIGDLVRKSIAPLKLDYSHCDPKYSKTRYEQLYAFSYDNPWLRFMMMSLFGVDKKRTYENNIDIPSALADVWTDAMLEGTPLANPGQKITTHYYYREDTYITPCRLSIFLLIVSLLCVCLKYTKLSKALLAFLSCIGLCILVVTMFSPITIVHWNWLLVILNPLLIVPIFWTNRIFLRTYVIVIILWILAILFYPYYVVDPVYVIVAISLIFLLSSMNTKRLFDKRNNIS